MKASNSSSKGKKEAMNVKPYIAPSTILQLRTQTEIGYRKKDNFPTKTDKQARGYEIDHKLTFSSTQWTTIDGYFFESQRKKAGTPISTCQYSLFRVIERIKTKHLTRDQNGFLRLKWNRNEGSYFYLLHRWLVYFAIQIVDKQCVHSYKKMRKQTNKHLRY